MWVICCIILGIVLCVACFAVFVKVRLYVFASTEDVKINLKFGFIKIPLYPASEKNKVKEADSDKKFELGIGAVRDFWENNSSDIKKSLIRLKNRVVIERFNFEYKCGFSDAAVTAIMYGVVHGLYCNVFSFMDRHFKIKEMRGDINAVFNENRKYIALNSVFRLSVSDIIYVVAALLPVIKNIKKQL